MSARDDYPYAADFARIGYPGYPQTQTQIADALAEIDRRRAEVKLMRPVIEAAEAFVDDDDDYFGKLVGAVYAYRAAVVAEKTP